MVLDCGDNEYVKGGRWEQNILEVSVGMFVRDSEAREKVKERKIIQRGGSIDERCRSEREEAREVRKPDLQGLHEPFKDSGGVDMKTFQCLLMLRFKELTCPSLPCMIILSYKSRN